MEEKKFVQVKKEEFGVKEFIKKNLGKGKISSIKIEYTPIGEKIIVSTSKPGFVIGRKGERIMELTETLKKNFSLENPHIEIQEIQKPEFDSQTIADEIAMSLERFGSMRFKVIAYRTLEKIMKAGASGVEIRLSGKLPSERARTWRFAAGYLKKTGDTAKVVSRAKSIAETKAGVVGIKVSILSPDAYIHDRIEINEEIVNKIRENIANLEDEIKEEVKKTDEKKEPVKKTKKKRKSRKKKEK